MNKTIFLTVRQALIITLVLLGVIAVFALDNNVQAEDMPKLNIQLNCPEDGLVKHPCRQPDALITVKLSHYWPPLGGPNCFHFVDGECLSGMSSGYPWQDWVDRAAACPSSLPFGTIIEFNNRRFICLDRGGKVVQSGNTYWVDTLTEYPLGVYGSEVIGSMWYPIWYLSRGQE